VSYLVSACDNPLVLSQFVLHSLIKNIFSLMICAAISGYSTGALGDSVGAGVLVEGLGLGLGVPAT
jgi:hypothetical protein